MKKTILSIIFLAAAATAMFAQTSQSDDELFGGDDDFFFEDDGIIELEENSNTSSTAAGTTGTTNSGLDLSHGALFDNGSIKIGGRFSTSLGTSTTLWEPKDDTASDEESKNFGDYLSETTLTPTASALLSIDARPTQTLRMYTKFGLAYPFNTVANSVGSTTLTLKKSELENLLNQDESSLTKYLYTTVNTTVTDYLQLKELFTDFSIKDRAFFRFGLHTVTWGTGYFFSPVSDVINTSSIDPENTSEQVNGALNLRTQITFLGSQNCLWFYVIPSTDTISSATTASYAKDTALAGKADLLFGNVEVGVGGYYKYKDSPKAILTASGSLKKVSLFAEALYQHGAAAEWTKNSEWSDKTGIFEGTIGCSYYWKTPQITLVAQYYYDSNDVDTIHQYFTYGHNFAAALNFGKIGGNSDLSATIFAMGNYGKDELPVIYKKALSSYGISSTYFSSLTVSGMLSYSPISALSVSAGPYLTWADYEQGPNTAFKINLTLGGGKF